MSLSRSTTTPPLPLPALLALLDALLVVLLDALPLLDALVVAALPLLDAPPLPDEDALGGPELAAGLPPAPPTPPVSPYLPKSYPAMIAHPPPVSATAAANAPPDPQLMRASLAVSARC
jgi:hypothetical protein